MPTGNPDPLARLLAAVFAPSRRPGLRLYRPRHRHRRIRPGVVRVRH